MKLKNLKINSFILLIVLCTFFVSSELLINPSTIQIDLKKSTLGSYDINITNTFNFRIQNFQFTNLSGFSFPSIVLEPNQTKTINFNVTINDVKTETINSNVIFKYLVDIPPNPQTFQINISDIGFTPSFLTIHQGDTIIWNNLNDFSHTVTSSTFDYDIPANSSYTSTYNNVETIQYQDFDLFWTGTINVLSNQIAQEVNNPSYNKIFTVNLNIFSDPTVLNISIPETSFQMQHNDIKEGIIMIKNIGNELATKVSLSSNNGWVNDYDINNFNLNIGDTKYVKFYIEPLVFGTNETNKTYNIEFSIKGVNTEIYKSNISVFIKYSNSFDNEGTEDAFLNSYRKFCSQYPTSLICNNSIQSGNNGSVVIRDPEIPLNLTATQFYSMLKQQSKTNDAVQRNTNDINELKDSFTTFSQEMKDISNQSLTLSQKSEDRRNTNETIIWILSIFSILIVGFLAGFGIVAKIRKAKYQLYGGITGGKK